MATTDADADDNRDDGRHVDDDALDDDEPPALRATDPDDYQRTRRLKEIHDAKREVQKTLRQRHKLIVELGENFAGKGTDTYERHLAQTVAYYGDELLPLLREARDKGALDADDVTFQATAVGRANETNITFFVETGGYVTDDDGNPEIATEVDSRKAYRTLNTLARKVGLGLDLETAREDSWEI